MRKSSPKPVAKLRLLRCEAVINEVHTRIPFRYGQACLTASPTLLVRLHVESEKGKQAVGLASDCLPPAWFDKNPGKTYRDNVDDQLAAFHKAREIYLLLGSTPRTPFELWHEAYGRILEESYASGLNALTVTFGSSFFERAMVDALCRLEEVTFFQALKNDLLGMHTSTLISKSPLEAVACRHTVGLADPLTTGEIPEEERLDDGLPQALEEDIEAYGLRYFKVKVAGDHDHDLERLSRIAALLAQRCRGGYHITLDGNEQYRELEQLQQLVAAMRERPYGELFCDNILFIEQPLHRDVALDPKNAANVKSLTAIKPVIIDESDDHLDSFERAVELGYHGISHKNCKGIFRSLKNRALVQELNKKHGEGFYFQTAEDLANLPVIPLQQDLATVCALGIEHVERNGHHFFRGLDHLPRKEAESAFQHHSDLYEEREDAIVLRVVDGTILCKSIVGAEGYGYASEIAFDERTPVDEWSFERLGL